MEKQKNIHNSVIRRCHFQGRSDSYSFIDRGKNPIVVREIPLNDLDHSFLTALSNLQLRTAMAATIPQEGRLNPPFRCSLLIIFRHILELPILEAVIKSAFPFSHLPLLIPAFPAYVIDSQPSRRIEQSSSKYPMSIRFIRPSSNRVRLFQSCPPT